MNRSIIHKHQAPQAVGTYSQAVRAGDMANIARFKQIMGEAEAILFCPPA